MITINLTTEDYILMKNLLSRITNQIEREPVHRHWIKDGQYMVNTRSGTRIDIVTNQLNCQIGERSGSDVKPQCSAADQTMPRPTERTQ